MKCFFYLFVDNCKTPYIFIIIIIII